MKRIRWIKGPMERDRSRFAVLTLSQSDLVQGTPGTATIFAMQNREPPGLPGGRETGAHTPYVLFHRMTPVLLVAPRHMATFDYLDMQMIRPNERARGSERGRRTERDASPSLFLLETRANVNRVCMYVCALEKGVRVVPLVSRAGESSPRFPLKKNPPRHSLAKGAHCCSPSGICMSTHFSTRVRE